MKFAAPFMALALLTTPAMAQKVPHLELDLSGPEYRELLKAKGQNKNLADSLNDVIALGERNLDWFETVNAARAPSQRFELSTAETQIGYPIDGPRESNRQLVLQRYEDLRNQMPAAIRDVLYGRGELPREAPVADDVYLEYVRLVDRLYQDASRWLLQEPYLATYASYAVKDIRGYYTLQQEPNAEDKLRDWSNQDAATKTRLSAALVGMCRNSRASVSACNARLNSSIQSTGNALKFYRDNLAQAQHVWNSYWELKNPRPEMRWSGAEPNVFVVPFLSPGNDDVQNWLEDNIEDEWRLGDWHLDMQFRQSGNNLAHVEFKDGATPHVNGLGGNTITMDGNRNIQEYTARWTIRHEFGHVLGLSDCYVEFYDQDRGVMVSYQLDLSDLMCSRKGHLKQRHVDALKRAYFKP